MPCLTLAPNGRRMPVKTSKSMFGPTQTGYTTLNEILTKLNENTQKPPTTVEEVNIFISHFNYVIEQIKKEKNKTGSGL